MKLMMDRPRTVAAVVALVLALGAVGAAGAPSSGNPLRQHGAAGKFQRKPGRVLSEGEEDVEIRSAAAPTQESSFMINNPLQLCDGCPKIYGFTNTKPKAGVTINSEPDGEAPSWVVVMRKLQECQPDNLCREAEAVGKGRFDGKCMHTYSSAILGLSIQMDYPNMASFANATRDCVSEVWRDSKVSIQALQSSPTWGLDRIDQLSLPLSNSYSYTADGTGVHAYIIDTGVRASHTQFRHQDGTPGSRVHNTYSGFDDGDSTDCHGHGTHVAATLGGLTFGVAKNVEIHAVRVLDCQGNAQYSRVIKALDHLSSNHSSPAVAVLSLGGEPYNALDLAVQALVDSGITVAVAAGNDNREACLQSPARVPSVITVAGSSAQDTMYWNSNYGECVDIFAPGVKILSALQTSDTATGFMTGTSMAAPFVAGAAALFLERNPTSLPYIVSHALAASGSMSQLDATKGSPNILLNTNVFSPVLFSPPEFRITDQTAEQAFWVSVTLAKQPTSSVLVTVDPVSANRGTMTIDSIDFKTTSWNQPQYFVFEPSADSPRGVSYNLVFLLKSDDPQFDGLETYFQVTDTRQKLGEVIEQPLVINSLPFVDNRDTLKYSNDYNVDCSEWGDRGTGNDVVFRYIPPIDQVLDINLCDSEYDTKVYVFRKSKNDVFACNDDRCGYQSRLRIKVMAGETYYIIVDGYDGEGGRYILEIREITGLDLSSIPPGEVDESINPLPPDSVLDQTDSSQNNIELLSLALSNCDLEPSFSAAETSYSCTMPPGSPEVTVSYVTSNPQSDVEVLLASSRRRRLTVDDPSTVSASAAGYKQLQLKEGRNIVRVQVTSPDGNQNQVYSVTVKLLSDIRETRLKSVTILQGNASGLPVAMLPPFNYGNFEYSATVFQKTSLLWITVETLSTNPGVTVMAKNVKLASSNNVASGVLAAAVPVDLSSSDAVILKVVAADGETTAQYRVTVALAADASGDPIDCAVSAWGPWQECSRPCGAGVQMRERTVLTKPANSGAPCPTLVQEQACNTAQCELNCSVSPWGQWSQCSTRCGSGFQTRTRYVLDVPSGSGGACPELTQQKRCFVPTEQCYQDSDCKLGPWGQWSECSKSCGGGTQTRNRDVVAPQLGNGLPCSVMEEVQPCNTQACSAECQVSNWGRWDPCDSACGPGLQRRRRTIISVPTNGTAMCPPLIESRSCTSPACLPGQNPYPDSGNHDLTLPTEQQDPNTIDDRKPFSLDSIADSGGALDLADSQPQTKYRWVIYGFGECDSLCGGGSQNRTVQCAYIEDNGWELADDRTCLENGAGPMPSTTRACNVQQCDGTTILPSPWGTCNATCGVSSRQRAAVCKGFLGLLLPLSSCLHSNVQLSEPCHLTECSSEAPYWHLGQWGDCPSKCNEGIMRREATCMNKLGNSYSPATCSADNIELSRVCNSQPCTVGVWRVGPWSACSSACEGTQSRQIICVSLDSNERLKDEACERFSVKPATTQPCGLQSCTECGPQSSCSGNGHCEATSSGAKICVCVTGYTGVHCEAPPTCVSGIVDVSGTCCPGSVDAGTGQCCEANAVVDSHGSCCKSQQLDACGQCDGLARVVDITGSCCSGVLDASGFCCTSRMLDECGVCDGDGTTCATVLSLVFAMPGIPDVESLVLTATSKQRVKDDISDFVNRHLLQPLGQKSDARMTGSRTMVLQVQPYAYQNAGLFANSGPDAGLAISRASLSNELPGSPLSRNVQESRILGSSLAFSAPRKPRRHLQADSGADYSPSGPGMVPVSQAWLQKTEQLLSTRVQITGPLSSDGTSVGAAASLDVLRLLLSAAPDNGAGGAAAIASDGQLLLTGIDYVERRGICGNYVCEVGERLVAFSNSSIGTQADYESSLNGCQLDCPLKLLTCSVPLDSVSGEICGGVGRCMHASGVCECFEGYAGDDCGSCLPGYNRVKGGICAPSAALLKASTSRLSLSTSTRMSPTTLFFIAMSVVVIGICSVVIGGAFIFLQRKKQQAEANSSGRGPVDHHRHNSKPPDGVFDTPTSSAAMDADSQFTDTSKGTPYSYAGGMWPPPGSEGYDSPTPNHGTPTILSPQIQTTPDVTGNHGPLPRRSAPCSSSAGSSVRSLAGQFHETVPEDGRATTAGTAPPRGGPSLALRTSVNGDPELFTNMYWFPATLDPPAIPDGGVPDESAAADHPGLSICSHKVSESSENELPRNGTGRVVDAIKPTPGDASLSPADSEQCSDEPVSELSTQESAES